MRNDKATTTEGETMKLIDYRTNEIIRDATPAESQASAETAQHDGGAGVIMVQGRPCYVPVQIFAE
jgi:hypothetical protein